MKALEAIFWLIWLIVIIFLALTFPSYKNYEAILFVLFFLLIGILMYCQTWNGRRLHRLSIMIKNIDFSPLESEIKKLEENQEKWKFKISALNDMLNDFENYKLEQEKKYREVVRKVLDVDNELNKKYRLLGESVIKLSKDIKK